MTFKQCKKLYLSLAEGQVENDFNESEWQSIHAEMQRVLAAKSDRVAGKIIEWWGCWDRDLTATAWARKFRQLAKRPGRVTA